MNLSKIIRYKYDGKSYNTLNQLREANFPNTFFIEPITEEVLKGLGVEKVSEYPELSVAKSILINYYGSIFARRRDKVRWIPLGDKTYGFDCMSEDMINFMAVYTPILIKQSGTSKYNVYVSETKKELVTLSFEDFNKVYVCVNEDQFKALSWYRKVKESINSTQTIEELASLEVEDIPPEEY